MIGLGKLKRKRKHQTSEINFATALTVEDCIERLEKGPARTLDHRLTVRTDGHRFVVEAWLALNGRTVRMASAEGTLDRSTSGPTWVTGSVTYQRPGMSPWLQVPMLGLAVALCIAVNPPWPVWILWFGILAAAFQADSRSKARIVGQIPNLRTWVKRQLYEPPEQPA